jgi:hypothetical protein
MWAQRFRSPDPLAIRAQEKSSDGSYSASLGSGTSGYLVPGAPVSYSVQLLSARVSVQALIEHGLSPKRRTTEPKLVDRGCAFDGRCRDHLV